MPPPWMDDFAAFRADTVKLNSVEEPDEIVNQDEVLGSGLNADVTRFAKKVVFNATWEKAVLVVILSNAAWIGFDVDWNNGGEGNLDPVVFQIAENLYCSLFAFELIMRLLTYENKLLFFKDPACWKSNNFDMFLGLLMILEVWILENITGGANLNQFSLIRLLRLLRLLRISRIFRMVPELGTMVKSMAGAARSVSSALMLEVGIMYIFAVILAQWTKEHTDPCYTHIMLEDEDGCFLNDFFGTITKSLVTLLQILVFDDTFSIIRPILTETWYMGCLLILFIVLGSWTVLNMLIGIIAELVYTGTAEEKMKILELRVREVFASLDADGSGTVSREEFNRNGAHNQLVKLGISRDILRNAFDILDNDGSGTFDMDEFMSMIMKLLNPPQSQDLQVLQQRIAQIGAQLNIAAFGQARKASKRNSTPVLARAATLAGSKRGKSTEGVVIEPALDPKGKYDYENAKWKSESEISSFTVERSFSDQGSHTAGNCQGLRLAADSHLSLTQSGAGGNHTSSDVHPFALEEPPTLSPPVDDNSVGRNCLELAVSREPEMLVIDVETTEAWELRQKEQAQDIFGKLNQLAQSAEKVEEALKLVHRTKLWDSSETEKNVKLDGVLENAGLRNLSASDKVEARGLLDLYSKLNHSNGQSTSSESTRVIQPQPGSTPSRPSLRPPMQSPDRIPGASPQIPAASPPSKNGLNG